MNFYKIALAIVQPLFHMLFWTKYMGRENIPAQGPLILCSNHRSYLDPVTIAVGIGIKNQVFYMAKEELFRVPVLGWIARKAGAFPVNRDKNATKSVRNSFAVLENGGFFGIFPEGTRSKSGELQKGKAGVMMIAAQTNAKIMPVAISCRGRVRIFKKMTVRYGKPVTLEELGVVTKSGTELRNATRLMMDKIGELLDNS